MTTPVFIPSKNRATAVKTAQQFDDQNYPTIVVEPQDEKAYRQMGWKNLLVLPKNDQGIAYVRNYILEYVITSRGSVNYWMMDDDISKFIKYIDTKGIKLTGEAATYEAEKHLNQVPNIAQGAMEYNQFAWSQRVECKAIGYCDVAVLMYPKKIGSIRYRSDMNLKEDRDFTIQLLAAGHYTARATKIAFAAPKNGSNKGGLSDFYAQEGREAAASERMVKAWPGICTFNRKSDGRPDVKINWKHALCDNHRSESSKKSKP